MAKKAKKVPEVNTQTLTESDLHQIGLVILGWSLIYNLIRKLTIEEYSEKVLLKQTKSRVKYSRIRLLFDAIRTKGKFVLSSKQFNENLAKEMLERSDDEIQSQLFPAKYLHSTRMTEILTHLTEIGVFSNLRGKKAIKHELDLKPGSQKGKTDRTPFGERFRGYPSAYKINERLSNLQSVMAKPKACELVYKILKDSNILYECEKYFLASFFIALKKSNSISLAKIISKSTNSTPIAEAKIMSLQERLRKLDHEQIKKIAAETAKISLKSRKDDAYFLLGLFKM